jgi:hypothetical protein
MNSKTQIINPSTNIISASSDNETSKSGAFEASLSPIGDLPCLYRNNSIEIHEKSNEKPFVPVTSEQLSEHLNLAKKYRKTSTALAFNVQCLADKYPLKNLGFLTLTFKDNIQCYKEASKRFNSLSSNVLNDRYQAWMKVMERQKSGRIHFHLIVVLNADVRTGFDFPAISRQDYSSAGKYLRSEWSFWRFTAKKFGFGRTELLPIKSSSEAIGRYVGKYISKHLDSRIPDDKGARLVSYSKNMRVMNTKFSWVTEGSQIWRSKVCAFAHFVADRRGCPPTFESLRKELGPKWAYNHREFIGQMPV